MPGLRVLYSLYTSSMSTVPMSKWVERPHKNFATYIAKPEFNEESYQVSHITVTQCRAKIHS